MATKDIGNLRTRLSWEDEGANKSLTGFRQDLKGLRSEMNLAKSGGKEYANSLKGLRQQSDILTRQFKTQEQRVKELRKRYEESRRVKGEDAKETKNLASQYNNARAAMQRTEGQLDKVTAAIEEQINPWKRLGRNMTDTGDKMQTFGRGMSSFGREYSMKVTAPIVASGVAVFKAASDFESAFAGVEKTVDGSAEQMEGLRSSIRDMAKEIPASTTEIAAVAEAAGQLGIETESIEEFTKTMIDLGEATNMTSEQAATEFARFANIVGMSQDDFDKLGSATVALGNNMATTEAEISALSLRLAAQGSQVGMSEAQILALAGSMSSLGINAEAGGTAMTTVLKKIDTAVGESGSELEGFAKAAGVSSDEFAKAWEDDAIGALDLFIKGLGESGEEGENLTSILEDLGIKGIRESDTILRLAGASDILSDAVNLSSDAWEENSALTDEAAQRYATTESQLKIMWNRVKDLGITLGEALIPAVMDAIDAAEPLIQKIEDGAQAFSDMTEEEQQTILKMIALVAAVGPASLAIGGLTTGIGGLLKVGGGLSSLIGKAGGKGLAGRIGLLGLGGPMGLAVAGVAGLGAYIYTTTANAQELHDVNYNLIDSVNDEITALDELEDRFSKLHGKNKLTTDETLRYMDIMAELKDAKNEETIKRLTDEQKELAEKSGMTKDELAEFIGLNDELIEKTPGVTSALSDQGNAYIDNLEVLKEINAEKREELVMSASRELEKALENENVLLNDQKILNGDIKEIKEDIKEAQQARLDLMPELEKEELKQKDINDQIRDLKDKMGDLDGNALEKAKSQLAILELEKIEQDSIVEGIEYEKIKLGEVEDKLRDKLDKKNKDLEKTQQEIEEIEKLKGDYEQLILAQAGITAEKGRGLEKIDKELSKIDETKQKLKEQRDAGSLTTAEYQEQNEKLSTQRQRLENARKKLEDINTLAGETIYDKDVHIKTRKDNTYESLGKTIVKRVRLNVSGAGALSGAMPIGYVTGTDNHPGGPFIAGEEGYELGRLGNRWEMLNTGLYDRPAGYEVFTHDESKKIIRALNNMPGYATGARPSGEANRIADRLNNTVEANGQVVALLRDIAAGIQAGHVIEIDGEVITKVINENNAVNDVGNYF